MLEIELKAHVYNRSSVIEKINSFAEFHRVIIKDDEYYRLDKTNGSHISARIRREKSSSIEQYENISQIQAEETNIVLTYKKKESRISSEGKALEVNRELETSLSDSEPVKTLLQDSGYKKSLTKHKEVISWFCTTECGQAHLELCTVPPLGDFLEIEIIAESADNNKIEQARKILENLILKSGISLSDIENKYYSELLKEADRRNNV